MHTSMFIFIVDMWQNGNVLQAIKCVSAGVCVSLLMWQCLNHLTRTHASTQERTHIRKHARARAQTQTRTVKRKHIAWS